MRSFIELAAVCVVLLAILLALPVALGGPDRTACPVKRCPALQQQGPAAQSGVPSCPRDDSRDGGCPYRRPAEASDADRV